MMPIDSPQLVRQSALAMHVRNIGKVLPRPAANEVRAPNTVAVMISKGSSSIV
jgi:hypothetical protein